jgi:molybdopterin synthase catalytic subunit
VDIRIQLTTAPLETLEVSGCRPLEDGGACVEFRGVVRGEEDGRAIVALEYEAYEPMAERVMRQILEDLGRSHPCLAATVVHRLGRIPVGEAAIHVVAVARHRAEAFALVTGFMDRLKQDVPIWKRRGIPRESTAAPPAQSTPWPA